MLSSGKPNSPGPDPQTDFLSTSLKFAGVDVLVVCLSHSWGGLEQVAANDALELSGCGLRVRVLCLKGSPIHEYVDRKSELTVVPLHFQPRNFFDLGLRRELNRLIIEGVNLIHVHQTSLLGSITPWLWGHPTIPLIVTRHILSEHDKRNVFHRAVYSRVDCLLVMSGALRKNVLDTHPLSPKKVEVVHLGLDFERFDPAQVDPSKQRAVWGIDPDARVIGLVGRIDPAKGQDTFIQAAAGLLKNLKPDEDLKFVIVGQETLREDSGSTETTYLAELQAMVRQFRLDRNVIFTGYQRNIPEVMRAFDIFVMPSHREAFGLVAIEAMAMECPIIISKGGSADEIVGENEYGLTVRPVDAFDLQQQIRQLLDDKKGRLEMGRRARAYVKKKFDRRVRLQNTLQVYEKQLRRRSGR